MNTSTTNKISDASVSSKGSDESVSESSSVNGATSNVVPSVAATATKNRKSIIDETLLPSDEAAKVLARRAYNRECATRARKRSKQMVTKLEQQITELQEDKDALRRSVANMEKQVNELENQNKALKLQQMLSGTAGVRGGMVSDGGLVGNNNIGTSFPSVSMLLSQQQQQLRQQLQQQQLHMQLQQQHHQQQQQAPSAPSTVGSGAAATIRGASSSGVSEMDLAQLAQYMNGNAAEKKGRF